MTRAMLLTLLAFAVPTAALANNNELSIGTFEHGTITSTFANHFRVRVVGSLDTITLNIPDLSCDPREPSQCSFTNGTVTVVNPAGVLLFKDSLKPGYVHKEGTGEIMTASIFGELLPDPGPNTSVYFNFKFSGNTILAGDADVYLAPEPSALEGLLLGMGMLGLVQMTRRQPKLGT